MKFKAKSMLVMAVLLGLSLGVALPAQATELIVTGRGGFSIKVDGTVSYDLLTFKTAFGFETNAWGTGATAFGYQTKAYAPYATAFGTNTYANERNATAFGTNTYANGMNATAFGNTTTASGNDAVAMGNNTTATGEDSVAAGLDSVAEGNYSLAAGYNAKTSGDASFAAGWGTFANGYAAIALGQDTEAKANAVALGYKTKAEGRASTAVGYGSEAYGEGSFAGGGHVTGTQVDGGKAYGESSFAFGIGAVAGASGGTGNYTFAFGNNALASMDNAIAFGSNAKAEYANSVALGSNSVTSATNTISVGYSGGERRITNVAAGVNDYDAVNMKQLHDATSGGISVEYIDAKKSHSGVEHNANAGGVGSTAVGYGTVSSGEYSTALGNWASVRGANNSTAVGASADISMYANNSTAIGYKSLVNASDGVALGANTRVNDRNSVAIGNYSLADEQNTVSVGKRVQDYISEAFTRRIVNVSAGRDDTDAATYGQVKIAVNNLSFDSGTKKISFTTIGNDTAQYLDLSSLGGGGSDSLWTAGDSGTGSIKMAGGSNVATGDYSLAVGKENTASGETSVAIGLQNTASGEASTAMGFKSTAEGNYSLAAGYRAKTAGTAAIALGNNTFAKGYVSVALGLETTAEGDQSIALGYKTKATAKVSTATGYGSEAIGEGSFAGGGKGSTGDAINQRVGGKAYGLNSFAFGMGAVAGVSGAAVDYAGTIAMGNDAKAIHKNSVALGNNSVTVADYTLAVGDVSNSVLRRITGLADGVAVTDAATVGQVYSLWTAAGGAGSIKMTAGNNEVDSLSSNALAMGQETEAKGNNSLAVGYRSMTVGNSAIALGAKVFANGYAAIALGQETEAKTNAVALGYKTKAEAKGSTAVGYGSEALGEGSFAGGGHVTTSGAIGQREGGKAYGESSFAFGTGAVAGASGGTGNYTFAFGDNALASKDNAIAFGSGAKAEHQNSVALGSNSVTSAENIISVGYSGGERRITNVANGTENTDAATVGQLNAKADYYVNGGSVRDDVSTGKKYIDLNVYNNASSSLVNTVSIDVSSIGSGSIVSGDKTLTAGKNIGFTEYVDPADSTTKYAVGLLDNISGITSAEIGTTAKNVHLTNAGMTVTDNSSGTKSAGVTAEKVYVSSDGTIYSELGKTELKVNEKTYINENGINANGQKITNVADGTTDTDAVNYGQIRGAFVDVSYSGNVLTLTQVNGGTKTVNISSGGEASELVHKGSNASAVMIGKNTEATGQDALAFGNSSKANASEAVAVGYNNTVTGEKSTAVGNNNTVSGARSGAFGDPNNVTGSGSYAFGNDNTISGNNTFVMGNNVTATSNNAVILGHGSADGGDNTVSVGSATLKRRIVNVANAAADTDAVNLGQVNALLGTSGTGAAFYALKDEVAGIHSKVERLGTRINKVGAGAAALAAMHPVYDEDSKITFSAGLGAYRNEKAAALGAFYRFSDRVFMNCGATVGNDNNMYNIGLNFALDRHVGAKLPSKAVMARELAVLREKTAEQDAKIAKLTAMLQELLEKSVN